MESLLDALQLLDIARPDELDACVETLDSLSAVLARSDDARKSIGAAEPSIWPALIGLWRRTSERYIGRLGQGGEVSRDSLPILAVSLARFTRNLVAEVKENQDKAFELEPDIRKMLHHQTSFVVLQDVQSHMLTRLLTQTLSNTVTFNDLLMTKLWDTYMSLPEDQLILIRLLSSPDERTILATLILVTNCIHGSKTRATQLTTTMTGARLCVRLLDCMLKLYDAQEDSDAGKSFDIGYSIFSRLIEFGLTPDLYEKLEIPDEPVTPYQTTLLKLLDSYLQSSDQELEDPKKRSVARMLADLFFRLGVWTTRTIRDALGLTLTKEPEGKHDSEAQDDTTTKETTPGEEQAPRDEKEKKPLERIDVSLPKVCETLVIVTQCVISLTLDYREANDGVEDGGGDEAVEDGHITGMQVRRMMNESQGPEGLGVVECLIELLRLMDLFLPRIDFGQPVPLPARTSPPDASAQQTDPAGFSYLKRDLIRLLGILCHANVVVQNRVRACGGIPVVMGLCVIDERNPFLREHAIFTVRNLLEDNPENQAVVDAFKAVQE